MSIKQRNIGLIVGLVIIVLLSIVLIVRGNVRENSNAAVVRSASDQIDECGNDVECRDRILNSLGAEAGEINACRNLDGTELASCIRSQALTTKSVAVCNKLSGDDRDLCRDRVYFSLAGEEVNHLTCKNIKDEELRVSCARSVYVESIDSLEACSDLPNPVNEECKVRYQGNDIYESAQADACDSLESSSIQVCRSLQLITDFDGDGLTLREELDLGTSDTNRDSDGDGFDDATEIANGFNPLGE